LGDAHSAPATRLAGLFSFSIQDLEDLLLVAAEVGAE